MTVRNSSDFTNAINIKASVDTYQLFRSVRAELIKLLTFDDLTRQMLATCTSIDINAAVDHSVITLYISAPSGHSALHYGDYSWEQLDLHEHKEDEPDYYPIMRTILHHLPDLGWVQSCPVKSFGAMLSLDSVSAHMHQGLRLSRLQYRPTFVHKIKNWFK